MLYNCLEGLRIAGILLSPVMPLKMQVLLDRLGWQEKPLKLKHAEAWGLLREGVVVTQGDALFPRIDQHEK